MSYKNLVFIFTDQQRYDTLTVNGNRSIRVPNLDALAAESTVFRDAYCAVPVCSPSRATILSGLHAHAHGVVENNLILRNSVRCLPSYLNGYNTAYMGKWHLGNETTCQHGFDEWVSIDDYYYRKIRDNPDTEETNSSYHRFLVENGFMPDGEDGNYRYFTRDFATRIPERFSKPAFLAAEADRFLEQNRDRPFALYVSFLEPHPPYRSVNDDMYDPASIDLPPNFGLIPDRTAPIKHRFKAHYARERGRHFPLSDEHAWRKQIARYRGCVSLIDTYVGQILDSVRRNGLYDDTLVIFTSDHGDMMGDMGQIAKGVMFQPSVRVPLLFRAPWLRKTQRVIDGRVSQIDLVPTILEALEQEPVGGLHGESLYPVLNESDEFKGKDVFMSFHENPVHLYQKKKYAGLLTPELRAQLEEKFPHPIEDRTVITADGKRLTLTQSGEHEFYNLTDDPLERENLFGRPEYAPTIRELTQKIADWQQRTGDDATFFDYRSSGLPH